MNVCEISIKDYVTSCYTNDEGFIIYSLIKVKLEYYDKINLSFEGIDSASSSFINTAIIDLLDDFTFDEIRERLHFIKSNKSINELIKRRFQFEVFEREDKVYKTLK